MIDRTINDACCSLQAAVNQFIQKNQRRFRGSEDEAIKLKKHITRLVDHSHHILQTLTSKLTSLKQAITALYECWEMAYQTLQNSKGPSLKVTLQSILQHVLQCYLRLGDGMILLTSGECRHPGDMNSVKYKSKLTLNQVRGDGYTMLYSKDLIYSGFGWDEFFDTNCGVQARLCKALSQLAGTSNSNLWDTLIDYGAQLFESALDTHETNLLLNRKSLEDFREKVRRDLTKLLPNRKVTFATQDKMEYLEVRGAFKLQRRANEFQVKGSEGVLPNGWTVSQWQTVMTLPLKTINEKQLVQPNVADTRKRRRIIEDSDDQESEGCGLHLQEAKAEEQTSTNMSSLNAIKKHLGVDVKELELGREFLEWEERQETDSTEIIGQDDYDIKNQRGRVARLRKTLSQTIDAQEDALEIWDVREHLRKSIMQLGIELLTLRGTQHLTEAQHCFQEAMNLVHDQQIAHELIVRDTNDDTEGAWLIRRNMLLLKGRAQTNYGIALLELSLVTKAPSATRKKQRSAAASALVSARKCAERLQALSSDDGKRGASACEVAFDIVEAIQLEALAWRSYGSVLWHDGNENEAINAFGDAAALRAKIGKSEMLLVEKEVDFLNHYMTILVECYYSSTTLFDLIAAKIERLVAASSSAESSSTKLMCKTLMAAARNAAVQAKSTVASMREIAGDESTLVNLFEDNGVLLEDDIDAALSDLQQRCNACADGAMNTIPRKSSSDWRGNREGLSSLLLQDKHAITRRFVVMDFETTRLSKNERRFASGKDFSYTPPLQIDGSSESDFPIMKWGDELLILTETLDGREFVPQLPYPACVPPLSSAPR